MPLFFLLFSFLSLAETVSVQEVVRAKAFTILKLRDGRVAYLHQDKSRNLTGKMVSLTLDESHNATNIKIIGDEEASYPKEWLDVSAFEPTVLSDYTEARKVMSEFNRKWLETAQCYDRAHVWVFDEYKKYDTKFMKAFVFFSDHYIEKYKFQWWFHAAPFTYVRMNGRTTPRVLDPKFAKDPLQFKKWTDIFMKNDAQCRPINAYSQYTQHPGEDDCFLMEATMHYWQPRDLEALEKGIVRSKFIDWEVSWAFKEGFGIVKAFDYGTDQE